MNCKASCVEFGSSLVDSLATSTQTLKPYDTCICDRSIAFERNQAVLNILETV